MNTSILAHTATLDAIHNGLTRYDLSENVPAHRQRILCAACERAADIWHEDTTPMCGRCYLIVIGALDEEVPV